MKEDYRIHINSFIVFLNGSGLLLYYISYNHAHINSHRASHTEQRIYSFSYTNLDNGMNNKVILQSVRLLILYWTWMGGWEAIRTRANFCQIENVKQILNYFPSPGNEEFSPTQLRKREKEKKMQKIWYQSRVRYLCADLKAKWKVKLDWNAIEIVVYNLIEMPPSNIFPIAYSLNLCLLLNSPWCRDSNVLKSLRTKGFGYSGKCIHSTRIHFGH